MLPGPSVDQQQAMAMGVRIDVMLGSRAIALDLPVKSVTLAATTDRTVSHLLEYQLPLSWIPTDETSPAAGFGQRSHLTIICETERGPYAIERGFFVHDNKWQEDNDAVSVSALDLMQQLEESQMLWPSSPAKGVRLSEELQRLAGNHFPVILDDGVANALVDSTLQWNRSRTEAVRDLAAGYGFIPVVKPDGYLHAMPLRDSRHIDATYTGKDLLLDAKREGQGRPPNHFMAVGEHTEGSGDDARTSRWSAEGRLTLPPFGQYYGDVTDIIEVQSATSQLMVSQALATTMAASGVVSGKRSFEIVLDPRLELGDVIGVVVMADGAPTEYVVGRVCAFSMDFDSQKMRVDVEVLAW